MRKILILVIVFLIGILNTRAQKPSLTFEGSAGYKIIVPKVKVVRVEGINYVDLDAQETKYSALLNLTKNYFEITITDKNTGKVVSGIYHFPGLDVKVKIDPKNHNKESYIYDLSKGSSQEILSVNIDRETSFLSFSYIKNQNINQKPVDEKTYCLFIGNTIF